MMPSLGSSTARGQPGHHRLQRLLVCRDSARRGTGSNYTSASSPWHAVLHRLELSKKESLPHLLAKSSSWPEQRWALWPHL